MLDQMFQLVGPGDIVVDIGANIGTVTVAMAKRVGPTGAVHAFEAQRIIYQRLVTNVGLNNLPNVHTYNVALGETNDGVLSVPTQPNLQHASNMGSFSFMDADGNAFVQEKEDMLYEDVPQRTLDSYNFLHVSSGNDCPKLLKLDIEMMETMALKGARSLINRSVLPIFSQARQKIQMCVLVTTLHACMCCTGAYNINTTDLYPSTHTNIGACRTSTPKLTLAKMRGCCRCWKIH